MPDDEDRKKTMDLGRPGPHEAKTVMDLSSLPILVEEVRGLRKDGIERGNVVKTLELAIKTLESGVRSALMQIQQYYELFGGKIRAVEGRLDSNELRVAAWEAQLAELKRQLEARLVDLEKQAVEVRNRLANLSDTKLGVSVLPGVEAKISLSEEQMAQKLLEEAETHAANLAAETAAREAAAEETDRRVDARIAPLETKIDTLLTVLHVQPPPPPAANPDGSIRPAAEEDKKKKKPKNAIERQTRLAQIGVGLVSIVGAGGFLDKIGVLDALGRFFAKLWH